MKMPAAIAPKRAMEEPICMLEAAPVGSEPAELVPVPWKPASSVELAVARLLEEVVDAVRVAELMVVLREIGLPVPDALAPVPMGVIIAEVVLLEGC